MARKGFEAARDLLKGDAFPRERAVTLGDITRILVDKGEVDEALSGALLRSICKVVMARQRRPG